MSAFVPSPEFPLIFGGVVACGLPGDELTGPVNLPLYATGSASMKFSIPTEESAIQVAFCMAQVGGPTSPVLVSLYASGSSIALATGSFSPGQVPTPAGWTGFITLTPASPLAPGYYTIVVTSPASSPTNHYIIYINLYGSFVDPNASASYTPPPGVYGNSGSPVIWVKTRAGTT